MPTPTYDLISTTTLATATGTVVFSSLPQTYRDLILVSRNSMNAAVSCFIRFNNDTGANYTAVRILNSSGGSTATSDNFAPAEIGYNTTTNSGISNILDYSATNKHKTYFTRWGNADGTAYVQAYAARWANTAAITTISITPTSNEIVAGSTFSLYGIIS
jgi:hypothetical protein